MLTRRARVGRARAAVLDRYAPWAAVALLAVLVALDLLRVWRITNHHDLDVFLLAARRLVAGQDIYADAASFQAAITVGTFSMKDNAVVWPYAYAPLIAALAVPFNWLPLPAAQALWWGLNVAALLGGSWLCLAALGRVTSGRAALALLLIYRFDPVVVTLRLGQIELIQFLLLAAALYAFSRGRERSGGAALGLAAGIKFFPAALIGLLIWRRRWRAAAWAIAVALVTIIGSFALVGFDKVASYLAYTAMYGIGGAFAAFPLNQSLNGFFSRNLIHNVFSPTLKEVDLPGLAKGLTLACDLAIVAGSAWLTWRSRGWPERPQDSDRQGFAAEFALAVVALLLISPHSQVYTYVWVLLPFIVLVMWLLEQGRGVGWAWGGLTVAYLLVGRSYTLFVPALTRLVQAHYLFGALLLWGLIAAVLWRGRGAQQAAPSPFMERSTARSSSSTYR